MTSYFAPLRAKSGEPLALDMQSLFLTGRVLPFGAKLSVTHVFRSSEKSPVEVVYCFPLPRDASLAGFQISGESFSISSRLERATAAEERYEEALEDGSLAALTQQNLDGLVNLTIGNLRTGETVSVRLDLIAGLSISDGGFRLRFPFTVAPCYHSQMRASLNAPNVGIVELPEHVTRGAFLPPFHRDASGLHTIGFDLKIEPAQGVTEIASPSHALRLILNDSAGIGAWLSLDRDIPNRDLVLDVKCDWGAGRAWSDKNIGDRKHFAVIAPSTAFGQPKKTSRRVVFLLDRSGSMEGSPIKQARNVVESCLRKLSSGDQFGIVAFDSDAERFRDTMLLATGDNVDEACTFVTQIEARGGTEIASAIEAAAQLLGESAGEIFVITDGQVFGTVDILRQARKCEIRLFCLGIGSASQDRFLELLARQTGGICRFVMPSERIDAVAFELFAATGGSVARDIRITNGTVRPPSDGPVFSGTPYLAFGDIEREAGAATLEWPQGSRLVPFDALDAELQGLIEKLQGAKLIADFEARYNRSDTAAQQRLVELSERYGLASSEMSLVAVVQRADDESGDVPKTKIVPVGMPQDTEFASYFRRKRLIDSEASLARFDLKLPFAVICSLREHPRTRLAAVPPSETAPTGDLLSALRAAIGIVDDHTSIRAKKGINDELSNLLTALVSGQDQVEANVQKTALAALIDFLSGDLIDFLETGHLDLEKWHAIREELETAWPELRDVGQAGTAAIRASDHSA